MRLVRTATLAVLVSFPSGPTRAEPLAAQQRPETTWTFETGDLRGWSATGDAFRFQPIRGDNPSVRGRGQPSNHVGEFWVGTFEHNEGPGAIQGDGPVGSLSSEAFPIPDSITFRIGGGSSFETRVELLVLDEIEGAIRVLFESGRDEETMRRRVWDTRRWVGQPGRIRIVDEASGPWGHVNVDHFRFLGGPPTLTMVPGLEVFTPQRPNVPVPGLIGRPVGQAEGLLAQNRLTLGEVGSIPHAEPPGTVVGQAPGEGTMVFAGSAVEVTVSEWIRVPNLVGRDTSVARQILSRAGLRSGQVGTQFIERVPGSIVEQAPPPGDLAPPGTPVSVVVAEPVPTVVPLVLEMDLARAERALAAEKLRTGRVTLRPSDRPTGTVVVQDPPAGTTMAQGAPIDLVVAQGVPVPDLLSASRAQAERDLAEAGLVLGRVDERRSGDPIGAVLSQEPTPREIVPLRTPVDVQIATGVTVPALVGVPDLTMLDSAGASVRLADAELRLGPVTSRVASATPGAVVGQSPDADDVVPAGTPVSVVLSQWATVPDVSGLDSLTARNVVSAAGFTFTILDRPRRLLRTNAVLSQTPTADVPAAPTTNVVVVVARPIPGGVLAGGFLALFGAIAGWVRGQSRRKRRQSGPRPAAPAFHVEPHPDPGRTVLVSAPRERALEVRWRPRGDPGSQTVQGPSQLVVQETIERLDPGAGGLNTPASPAPGAHHE